MTAYVGRTIKLLGRLLNPMIKTASAAIACIALAAPAMAGPYVNVENNAGFAGSDFGGSTTDFHIGYEGGNGTASYYLQGGPTLISPDGADAETKLSAKVGGSVKATEALSVYGEVSFLDGDTKSYGTKVGAKWMF